MVVFPAPGGATITARFSTEIASCNWFITSCIGVDISRFICEQIWRAHGLFQLKRDDLVKFVLNTRISH